MLWLAYEMTKDEKYRKIAKIQIKNFKEKLYREKPIDTHDIGFLYSLSCVAAYKVTGNEEAKLLGIEAADQLIYRYKEKGEFIQAWGDIHDPNNNRMIIDCCMNLPLLYWATEVTQDNKYRDIAYKHIKTMIAHIIKKDDSTYHTFYFDYNTGLPVKGATHQGFSDTSCWSRGQAWAMYGLPLSYSYMKDNDMINHYKRVTNYFIKHLPEDTIPYWDLIFTSGDEPRDSSAAAIAICGMMEMDQWLSDDDKMKKVYRNVAQSMLKSLIDNYTTQSVPESNGILLHAVYGKPQNNGIDECCIWGDYYYMESLVRLMKNWNKYW